MQTASVSLTGWTSVTRWRDQAISVLTYLAALALILNQTVFSFAWVFSRGRWVPLMLLAGAGVLWWIVARGRPRRIYWFDLAIVAFVALAFGSYRYSLSPRLSMWRAVSVGLVYVAVFWGVWWQVERRGPEAIARALLHAVATLLVLSIAMMPFLRTFGAYWRYQGLLGNPNAFGLLIALSLPLAFWAAVHVGRRAYVVLAALMTIAIIASQSRTMLLACFAGLGYFAYHGLPNRRRRFARLVLAVMVISLLLPQVAWVLVEYPARRAERIARIEAVERTDRSRQDARRTLEALSPEARKRLAPDGSGETLDAQLTRRLKDAEDSYQAAVEKLEAMEPQLTLRDIANLAENPRSLDVETGSGRTILWRVGLAYLAERPWTGYGFGVEDMVLRMHGFNLQYSIFSGVYFHNSFLGLALQLGIPGALLFYLPVGALAFIEWRSRARFDDLPLRFALRAILICAALSWVLESWPYSMGNAFSFLFWTCIMLLTWIHLSHSTRGHVGSKSRSA